jgi:tetratricopeptide (TPR) repeat protein
VLLTDLETTTDLDAGDDIALRGAAIFETHLADPQSAFDLINLRFTSRPVNGTVFETLCETAIRNEFWEPLAEAFERLVRATVEPRERAALYHLLAELLSEQAHQPTEALDALKLAHDTMPSNRDTLQKMEELATDYDLWQELDAFYQERSEQAGDTRQKVDLLRDRADVLETRLGRWEEAFDQILMAFQIDPDNPEVEGEIYRFAHNHGQWDNVIKLFEHLVKTREERHIQVHLLEEMARISGDELDAPDRAFEFVARAWRLNPAKQDLRDKLEALGRHPDRLAKLVDAYEWEGANRKGLSNRVAAWLTAATTSNTDLDDMERALRCYTEAFRLDPGSKTILQIVEKLLFDRDQSERFLGVLTEWIALVPQPEHRASLFKQIAKTAIQLGLMDEAIEAYRGVLSADPENLDALDGLARLHKSVGAWDRMVRCLQQSLKVATDVDYRLQLLTELIELLNQLGRHDEALLVAGEMVESYRDADLPTEDLVTAYLNAGKAEAAVNYLQKLADRSERPAANEALLRAALVTATALGDPKGANRICQRITRTDHKNRGAWMLQVELAEGMERWQDLVDALGALAETEPEEGSEVDVSEPAHQLTQDPALAEATDLASLPLPTETAVHLGRAAEVLEKHLFYTDRALVMWEKASLKDDKWAVPSLQMARLARELGSWDRGVVAAAEAARRLTDVGAPESLSFAHFSHGLCLEQTEDPNEPLERSKSLRPGVDLEGAVTAYEEAVRANPRNSTACRRYEAALSALDQMPRSAEMYGKLLESELSDEARRDALVCYARCLDTLGESDAAAKALDEALDLGAEGDDGDEIRGSLADLAHERGQHGKAIALYSKMLEEERRHALQLPSADEPDTRKVLNLHLKLARAAEASGDSTLAQEHYTEIYTLDQSNIEGLLGLGRLALQRRAMALAGNFAEEATVAAADDPTAQRRAMLLNADIQAGRGNIDDSIATLEALVDAGHEEIEPVLSRLVEHYVALSHWEPALNTLLMLRDRAEPGSDRAKVLVRVANIFRHHLDAADDAWQALALASEEDPDNMDAREEALSLAVALGRWQVGSELADELLPRMPDSDRTVVVRLLAARAAEGGGALESAQSHFAAAMQLDFFDTEALNGFIRTAKTREDWQGLKEGLLAHMARVGSGRPAIRGLVLRSLAEILEGPLDDNVGALDIYDELGELYPQNLAFHAKRLDLCRSQGHVDGRRLATLVEDLVRLGRIDTDSVRSLMTWYAENDHPDGAYTAALLLDACGETEPTERALLRSMDPVVPSLASADLVTDGFFHEHLRAGSAPEPISERLGEASISVRRGDPPESEPHSAEGLLRQVLSAIGIPDGTLRTSEAGFSIANGDAPRVTIGADHFEGRPQEALLFELGRLAALCLPEFIMSTVLGEFDYIGFHEAAIQPLLKPDDDSFGRDEMMAEAVKWWRGQFRQDPDVDPREGKSDGEGYDRSEVPNPVEWRQAGVGTAVRLGLLISSSLEAALEQTTRDDAALAGKRFNSAADLQQAIAVSPAVRELVAFALSPSYLEARARLGVALTEFDPTAVPETRPSEDTLEEKAIAEFEMEIDAEAVDREAVGLEDIEVQTEDIEDDP